MAIFTPPPIQFKRSIIVGNRPTDSDLLQGEIAINLRDRVIFTKNDSDVIVELGVNSDYDSDIARLYEWVDILIQERDSDNIITRTDHDSDFLMTYHDFRAADSDILTVLNSVIDSDIKKLYHDYQAADSDFRVEYDSDIPKLYHDYQAADSDLYVQAVLGLDSEIIERKNADSDIWDAIQNLKFEFDSDNIITRADHDSDFSMTYHDFRAADSDIINVLINDIDSDIQKIYHDYQAADSDFKVEYDSDIPKIYHDFKAADSDQTIAGLADVDVFTSPPVHGEVLTWDSDIQKWVPSYIETISELRRDSFTATAGQTDFVLNANPSGEVHFVRNAIVLVESSSYVDSDNITVKYVPSNNGNQNMRDGDIVEITYIVSTTTTIPSFTIDGGIA